jgi:hypothetical protein
MTTKTVPAGRVYVRPTASARKALAAAQAEYGDGSWTYWNGRTSVPMTLDEAVLLPVDGGVQVHLTWTWNA